MANFFKNLLMAFNISKLEQQLDVKVRLINKTSKEPIGGEGYSIRFYDKDEFDNDFLGEGPLNENGEADIRFDPSAMIDGAEDWGEEKETDPDLYFELVKDGKVIFTSEVWKDVDYDKLASFDIKEGKEIDFGTFLIDLP
jgi:hypothetical protein